jgi:hypothetical protein
MKRYDWVTALGSAVIAKAIKDLKFISHKKEAQAKIGRDAFRFLSGEGLEVWCRLMSLDAEYIRKKLREVSEIYKKYDDTAKSLQ